MPAPIMAVKLYPPRPRLKAVPRPRLIGRLDEGLGGKLTVVAAPAGFGKTTLVGSWIAGGKRPTAWISLDEADGDLPRFLAYLVAAVRAILPSFGSELSGALLSPQLPPVPSLLAPTLNEVAAGEPFTLVLDDYHLAATERVNEAVSFMLEYLPPRLHLVIVTRDEPDLPLALLRSRAQVNELRAADLRFTAAETAQFLRGTMGLGLAEEDVADLESRTEGWVAALQLAAISMRGHGETSRFIKSFSGGNRLVTEYLVENALERQAEGIRDFLLRSSILDRLSGPLCDAVLGVRGSQETLESMERANLFIAPLDEERRWYRYHRLFAESLRRRLERLEPAGLRDMAELHRRAALWFEENGLELEAFGHAVSAGDVDLAARIAAGKGMPLHFRGAVAPVLAWLRTLSPAELDARPALWVMYASATTMTGKTDVEPKLRAAEAALGDAGEDEAKRNIVGHIAAIRALVAASANDPAAVIAESRRALEYLAPGNLPVRTATVWKMGLAYQLQGDREAARRAFEEAVAISRATGNAIIELSATLGLAGLREAGGQEAAAEETYRDVLRAMGDLFLPGPACEARLGLARLALARGDAESAAESAAEAERLIRTHSLTLRLPAIAELKAALEAARRGPDPSAPPLVEPLSRRELEILGLVAAGLSNGEIGARLFLSLSTVKGHLQRIFGKLQVRRRTEAVARGRARGLL